MASWRGRQRHCVPDAGVIDLSGSVLSLLPFAVCLGTCAGAWKLFDILEEKEIFRPHVGKQLADLIEGQASVFSILARLPTFFLLAFDAIFTSKLLSLGGFIRSVIISTVILLVISFMVFDKAAICILVDWRCT